MLNPQKIKWMTRASIYEKKEERGALRTNRFFKGDYISYGMVKAAIGVTIMAFLVVIVWAILNAGTLMTIQNLEPLIRLGKLAIFWYVIALLVAIIIAFFVNLMRYADMQDSIKEYVSYLNKIKKIQDKEKEVTGKIQEDEDTW